MDTVSQAVGGSTDFNILVYGLANRMLQNDIPLKWAMRYDKVKIRGTASIDADPGTTLTDNNVGTDFTTGVEVGDLVINVSDGFTRAWVTAVVDANNLSLSLVDPGLTWSDGDEYVIDGHDFMATAEQIEPNCPDPDPLVCAPAALMNFAGGPFIISSEDPANIATALPLIAGYIAGTNSGGLGGDVNVFQTTVAADVDVRYTLRHRPFIAISDVNTGIHSKIMEAAGIPGSDEKDIPDNCAPPGDPAWDPDTCNWNQVVPVNLAALSCATIHFEPHRDKPNGEDEIPPVVDAVEAFVRNGGNFSAQCHAVQYFENLDEDTPDPLTYSGRFLTTVGILENGLGDDELDYPNAPMPFSQFTGPLEGGIGGSVPDWTLNTGAYKNKGHVHALNIPDNEDTHQAASGKLLGGAYSGGNIFYLGGHDYSGGDLDSINGVRMMLNTIFVPADRPTECGLNFGHPEMTIKKSSLTVEVTAAGQVVDYSYLVTNTGDVDLTNVTVTDNNIDTPPGVTCPATTLAVGESMTCTAQHTVTLAEMDAGGKLINIVTADSEETDPIVDDWEIPITQTPVIDIIKTGALDDGGDGVANEGDVINYVFTVTNTGNVTLSNIVVSDPLAGMSPIVCTISGDATIATLVPGGSETCTSNYAITQADIDAGNRPNLATAAGEDPGGNPVSDTDPHDEPLPPTALIDLDKTGALDDGGDGVANEGDVINYVFTVTNTGNVTLSNIVVSDPLAGMSPIVCTISGDATIATLLPRQLRDHPVRHRRRQPAQPGDGGRSGPGRQPGLRYRPARRTIGAGPGDRPGQGRRAG
jgi:uncharacterized repeat protein (TIGR01451 family)